MLAFIPLAWTLLMRSRRPYRPSEFERDPGPFPMIIIGFALVIGVIIYILKASADKEQQKAEERDREMFGSREENNWPNP